MSTTDKATPRPWAVRKSGDGRPYIYGADGKTLLAKTYRASFDGDLTKELGEANAVLIVRAVNNHEATLEVLAEFLPECDDCECAIDAAAAVQEGAQGVRFGPCKHDRLRALLASARGEAQG